MALNSDASLQNHSTRAFSDSRQSFVRLSSSDDNFQSNLLLNNSNIHLSFVSSDKHRKC